MRLSGLIDPSLISTEIQGRAKGEVVEELIALVARANAAESCRGLSEVVPSSESLQITVMDSGIAVARIRTEAVARVAGPKKLRLGVGISRQGIDFNCWDGSPVGIILVVVRAAQNSSRYLEVLSAFFGLLALESFKERLTAAKTPDDVVEVFRHFEDLGQVEASDDAHPFRNFSEVMA